MTTQYWLRDQGDATNSLNEVVQLEGISKKLSLHISKHFRLGWEALISHFPCSESTQQELNNPPLRLHDDVLWRLIKRLEDKLNCQFFLHDYSEKLSYWHEQIGVEMMGKFPHSERYKMVLDLKENKAKQHNKNAAELLRFRQLELL